MGEWADKTTYSTFKTLIFAAQSTLKFYLCRLDPCCKNTFYAASTGIFFEVFQKKFRKNANCKYFLTKFVNINNPSYFAFHGNSSGGKQLKPA